MSGQQGKAHPRRRLAVVFVLFAMAVLFVGLFAIVRQRRHDQLNADIIAAGGKLQLPPPMWTIHWNKWHGRSMYEGTSVELNGKSLPPGFLRDRDFLRHLAITDLVVREGSGTADEVAELVAAHPVNRFSIWRMRDADRIAAALHSKIHMSTIAMSASDLSDSGLASLPLHDVHDLSVHGSKVTAAGLLELQRCRNLQMLSISGAQLDKSSIDVIGQLPQGVSLTVHDSVTADVMRQFEGSRVRSIFLYNTTLSPDEIVQLQRDLPEIDVRSN